jgi:hypothetical protein
MALATNIQRIDTLEAVYEFRSGSVQRSIGSGEWVDLNGKSFLSIQVYQTSSDGVSGQNLVASFANAPDDPVIGGRGVVALQPTSIVGGSASWSTPFITIPPDVGNGSIQVYATWENLPFRYVKFNLGLGAVNPGGSQYMHIYAR